MFANKSPFIRSCSLNLNEICSLYFQDAFSLLAYSNPWASPLGWQLCPSRRETVCAALNSAILGNGLTAVFLALSFSLSFQLPFPTPYVHSNTLFLTFEFPTESMNYSWRPPLEICVAHACELLHLMANSAIGSCAFASIEDFLESSQ